jgi:hypothetical protein
MINKINYSVNYTLNKTLNNALNNIPQIVAKKEDTANEHTTF